eukprot:TRINITY_DN124726_c0_g1_i1.p1 TRINITY_DN124726_c0_g1~~TRINITY_DN124726_c0_g1_i1.p1  ORF type:complete len:123 (-),score=0.36 TRINITY_DN124726_c0_g1_i1:15-383(-)
MACSAAGIWAGRSPCASEGKHKDTLKKLAEQELQSNDSSQTSLCTRIAFDGFAARSQQGEASLVGHPRVGNWNHSQLGPIPVQLGGYPLHLVVTDEMPIVSGGRHLFKVFRPSLQALAFKYY